jgi:tripartite-type tricarboxylate transporter receptor subunit TctC
MKKDEECKREGMERREFLKLVGAVGGASALSFLPLSSHAAAKELYPAEDINFICSSPPGGGTDLSARGSAPFFTKALREVSRGAKGGNVKVQNMTGGAGAKSIYYLFQDAKPDGYTIGDFNPGNFHKFLMGQDKLPFDIRAFTWLYSPSTVYRVLVSGKRTGITSWETMIAKAKKEPPRWSISTAGGMEHLHTIFVQYTTGIQGIHTPWGGTSPSQAALIRGDSDLALVSYESIKSLVDAGEVNILLSFTTKRILPNVPTIAEKGFPQIPAYITGVDRRLVVAPPKLDPEVKRIMVAAARRMVVDQGYIDFCKQTGAVQEENAPFGNDLDNAIKENVAFFTRMDPIYKKYGL